MADLSDLEGRRDALQQDIDGLAETISAQQSTLDQELAEKRARLDELAKDKQKPSEAVPAPILTRYNFIRGPHPEPRHRARQRGGVPGLLCGHSAPDLH